MTGNWSSCNDKCPLTISKSKHRFHCNAEGHPYADWQAKDYDDRTGRVTMYHLWMKPFFRFIKHFIVEGGFLDGRVGLILSKTMAWGVYLRYKRMREGRNKNKY